MCFLESPVEKLLILSGWSGADPVTSMMAAQYWSWSCVVYTLLFHHASLFDIWTPCRIILDYVIILNTRGGIIIEKHKNVRQCPNKLEFQTILTISDPLRQTSWKVSLGLITLKMGKFCVFIFLGWGLRVREGFKKTKKQVELSSAKLCSLSWVELRLSLNLI